MVLFPSQECLFQYVSGTWTSFSQIHKRDHLPTFETHGILVPPPSDACRATIYRNKNRFICTGYLPLHLRPTERPSNFIQYLQQAEVGEKWCFASMDLYNDGYILAQAISQGDAITIRDGSFQDTYGTAAWVIEGCNSTGRMKGAVIVPGTAKDQSAYRSELAGIYSILITVKKICEFFDI